MKIRTRNDILEAAMLRSDILDRLDTDTTWDMIIIGGGATGLGCGVDASSRGYGTLLLEAHDFSQGTSSRSTKLVHGGVRYLQQGNVALVMDALHERGVLLRNAPHLVYNQAFVVPDYKWWERPFYGVGLKLYDMLAGKLGFGRSRILSRSKTLNMIPNLEPTDLRGGVIYYDGQFDDSRLAITLAKTMQDLGGLPVNHMAVTALLKDEEGQIGGVEARDSLTGKTRRLRAKVVINATGVFVDDILRMDDVNAPKLIAPSQGIHLVLDKSFSPGDTAIMVPHTDDGRVIFLVPWHGRVLVGTTDVALDGPNHEPRPMEEEITFLLEHAGRYLTRDPKRSDILSVFAGIRPLIRAEGADRTSSLSRDHHLTISQGGLVTIAGGKWTTYRKMGEDTVNQAARFAGLPAHSCKTENLPLHGWMNGLDPRDHLSVYGSDIEEIREMIRRDPDLGKPLHYKLPYLRAEVVWAVRREWARTLSDVLRHRTRALILDASVSMIIARDVAEIMARELDQGKDWIEEQVSSFRELARTYLAD
jgi:glycerol-3-phosphate dehydrogenase